jgi:hypothetical protein
VPRTRITTANQRHPPSSPSCIPSFHQLYISSPVVWRHIGVLPNNKYDMYPLSPPLLSLTHTHTYDSKADIELYRMARFIYARDGGIQCNFSAKGARRSVGLSGTQKLISADDASKSGTAVAGYVIAPEDIQDLILHLLAGAPPLGWLRVHCGPRRWRKEPVKLVNRWID